MLIMGIDPGTAITGYGILSEASDGKITCVDYGVILTPSGMDMPERLLILHEKLNELYLLHQPASCAVEKLFFQKNVKTAMAVGQARGVILLCAAQNHTPTYEYAPVQVKEAICGYGGADKMQVQKMVATLLLLKSIPKPDDAADALAVAFCHISNLHFLKAMGNAQ